MSLRLTNCSRGGIAGLALLALAINLAGPAEARPKVRFGSGGSGVSHSAGHGVGAAIGSAARGVARSNATRIVTHAAVRAYARSGRGGKVELVQDLPNIEDLQLPDGRYVDIGRIRGTELHGQLVGYVGSSREYLEADDAMLAELVQYVGFGTLSSFRDHLAATKPLGDPPPAVAETTPDEPAPPAVVANATTEPESGGLSWQSYVIYGCVAFLVSLVAFGVVARRRRGTDEAASAYASLREGRVAAVDAASGQRPPANAPARAAITGARAAAAGPPSEIKAAAPGGVASTAPRRAPRAGIAGLNLPPPVTAR
jgi:hypothetical protein